MAYLLETDQVIDLLEGVPEAVSLAEQLRATGTSMSLISYMEAYAGALRRGKVQALDELTLEVPVLPFSAETARRCAELRNALARAGKRVRPRSLDLMTAATALEHRLTLVTRNTSDFDDIPGLDLYRWPEPA